MEVEVEVDVNVVVTVVPVVRVPLKDPCGDAWACAGTTIASTTGLLHLDGMRMVAVSPPTVSIWRARRRVVPLILKPPCQQCLASNDLKFLWQIKRTYAASQEKPTPLRLSTHSMGVTCPLIPLRYCCHRRVMSAATNLPSTVTSLLRCLQRSTWRRCTSSVPRP